MRLDDLLLQNKISKKTARHLLAAGHLLVDGQMPTRLTQNVDADFQKITVSGERIFGTPQIYLLMNKPSGVVTSHNGQGAPTVFSLISADLLEKHPQLTFVGRLDKTTTGLLLFTDNGQLNYHMSQANQHVTKKYHVTTLEPLEQSDIQKFAAGLTIDDGVQLKPARLVLLNDHEADVEISEGKFHQVKKMFLSVGKKVVALDRTQFGPLQLPADLARGQVREISPQEFLTLAPFFI